LRAIEVPEIVQRNAAGVLIDAKVAIREDGISLDSIAGGQVIAHTHHAIEGDDVAVAAIVPPMVLLLERNMSTPFPALPSAVTPSAAVPIKLP
jgi:hypothetical protein